MKYGEKLKSYFDTFGYALLDNHFHLFVRVKPIDVVLTKGAEDFTAVNETFYKDCDTRGWIGLRICDFRFDSRFRFDKFLEIC
ncbi:MAG: hypothetical protein IPO37_25670 [Saprospiraceae bacterium]|nr:hypothetical protein [Saprospiraceae bacterium]